MIPYLEVLDKYTRKRFEIIEPSEFWSELSYYGVGEFEIYTKATNRALASLVNGNYIKMPNKPYLWVIEKVEKLTDADNGVMISATGREAKAILANRIISKQTQLATDLKTAVNALINNNAGATATALVRQITGLVVEDSEVSQAIEETQVSYENLLSYTDELLKAYECGAKLRIGEDKSLLYKIYKGRDKSATVIFSQMFDNLLSGNYSIDESNYRNFAYVGGQGEGSERVFDTVQAEEASGIDRREVFIDAKDISAKYTDAAGEEKELDLTTTAGRNTYKGWLRERGKKDFAKYRREEAFNGNIDTKGSNKVFGRDYDLGDIVRVQDNRIGAYILPRVLKWTINQTASTYEEKIQYGN